MTEPHLVHRLPWNALADAFKSNHPKLKWDARTNVAAKHRKRIEHFARCLTDALKEFAATDRSSDDERAEFDPYQTWDADRGFYGANMGYIASIIYGYIELNLILIDPVAFPPLLCQESDMRYSWTMQVLCGHCDGAHPDWLANHLTPVFAEQWRLKPLTADVLQRIRDHCALLFRCMHSLSESNDFLDPEKVASRIEHYMFRW